MNYEILIQKIINTKFGSSLSIRVALFLWNKERDGDGYINISLQTIGDGLSVDKSRARKAILELEKKELIDISRKGKCNMYKFIV